jgi:hypothetical protein
MTWQATETSRPQPRRGLASIGHGAQRGDEFPYGLEPIIGGHNRTMTTAINLAVNGEARVQEADDPDVPLLCSLRDQLDRLPAPRRIVFGRSARCRWSNPIWAACAVMAACWSGQCLAQLVTAESNTELSKETENPVTRHITVPIQYDADFNVGPYQATKDTFKLDQAVVPIEFSDDWALITRTKLPAYVQPPLKSGEHWESGLTNGYTTFFLSPEHGQGFYWGIGPVLSYPSATNAAVGVNKWGSGPSVAFVKKDKSPWVYGAVINNIWSFGGPPGSRDRTNSLFVNPFVSYHFGDGWSIGSSPGVTANWLSQAGQTWTVPIGGGFGKALRLVGQPIVLSVDCYYNAIRPQSSNDSWQFQFTLTLVFS